MQERLNFADPAREELFKFAAKRAPPVDPAKSLFGDGGLFGS